MRHKVLPKGILTLLLRIIQLLTARRGLYTSEHHCIIRASAAIPPHKTIENRQALKLECSASDLQNKLCDGRTCWSHRAWTGPFGSPTHVGPWVRYAASNSASRPEQTLTRELAVAACRFPNSQLGGEHENGPMNDTNRLLCDARPRPPSIQLGESGSGACRSRHSSTRIDLVEPIRSPRLSKTAIICPSRRVSNRCTVSIY